jgi:F-type H+-transporting ATPase subunit delta
MPLSEAQPDALANIYAKSLFELAEAKGGRATIEACLAELEEILELARANPKFGELLSSRALPAAARSASLDRIFKTRISDLTLNFLQVLNDKHRLAYLPPIAAAFDAIAQAKFGRVEVDVFTVEPIPADQISRLRDQLAAKLAKDVILHPYVDSKMIGGVKFRIGDQLIDGSIETKLRALRDQLNVQGLANLRGKIDRMLG